MQVDLWLKTEPKAPTAQTEIQSVIIQAVGIMLVKIYVSSLAEISGLYALSHHNRYSGDE